MSSAQLQPRTCDSVGVAARLLVHGAAVISLQAAFSFHQFSCFQTNHTCFFLYHDLCKQICARFYARLINEATVC